MLAMIKSAAANPDVWKNRGWAKTDFSNASVPFNEILSGGPPKDGIPSIDAPKYTAETSAKSRADMHIGHGSQVVATTAPGKRVSPLAWDAARKAMISACAVMSLSACTRLPSAARIRPSSSITQPIGA